MSETEQPAYAPRGWAGWPAPVAAHKASIEAAIVEAGVGFWMLPKPPKPPSNLAGMGVTLPGFVYGVPPGFVEPAPPEGVWPMSEATAVALQTVLQGSEE